MDKDRAIKKYSLLFEKLLAEKNLDEQHKTALQISEFSSKINEEVEKGKFNENVRKIQNLTLSMEHWKDESGYCNLKEKDIKGFIKLLKS